MLRRYLADPNERIALRKRAEAADRWFTGHDNDAFGKADDSSFGNQPRSWREASELSE